MTDAAAATTKVQLETRADWAFLKEELRGRMREFHDEATASNSNASINNIGGKKRAGFAAPVATETDLNAVLCLSYRNVRL